MADNGVELKPMMGDEEYLNGQSSNRPMQTVSAAHVGRPSFLQSEESGVTGLSQSDGSVPRGGIHRKRLDSRGTKKGSADTRSEQEEVFRAASEVQVMMEEACATPMMAGYSYPLESESCVRSSSERVLASSSMAGSTDREGGGSQSVVNTNSGGLLKRGLEKRAGKPPVNEGKGDRDKKREDGNDGEGNGSSALFQNESSTEKLSEAYSQAEGAAVDSAKTVTEGTSTGGDGGTGLQLSTPKSGVTPKTIVRTAAAAKAEITDENNEHFIKEFRLPAEKLVAYYGCALWHQVPIYKPCGILIRLLLLLFYPLLLYLLLLLNLIL
tara:strand:- start:658 stop:1632 length:975 start_codon:yes stop_codon:yes gene_type:complete